MLAPKIERKIAIIFGGPRKKKGRGGGEEQYECE